jgi:hypothetical protein
VTLSLLHPCICNLFGFTEAYVTLSHVVSSPTVNSRFTSHFGLLSRRNTLVVTVSYCATEGSALAPRFTSCQPSDDFTQSERNLNLGLITHLTFTF